MHLQKTVWRKKRGQGDKTRQRGQSLKDNTNISITTHLKDIDEDENTVLMVFKKIENALFLMGVKYSRKNTESNC